MQTRKTIRAIFDFTYDRHVINFWYNIFWPQGANMSFFRGTRVPPKSVFGSGSHVFGPIDQTCRKPAHPHINVEANHSP